MTLEQRIEELEKRIAALEGQIQKRSIPDQDIQYLRQLVEKSLEKNAYEMGYEDGKNQASYNSGYKAGYASVYINGENVKQFSKSSARELRIFKFFVAFAGAIALMLFIFLLIAILNC